MGRRRLSEGRSNKSSTESHRSKSCTFVRLPGCKPAEPISAAQPVDALVSMLCGKGEGGPPTLGEMSGERTEKRHTYAGTPCQAPKGNGICGAIISALNPYANVPVCQPCAARLMDQAIESGRSPEIRKYWAWLMRNQGKAAPKKLEDRPSGVRPVDDAEPSEEMGIRVATG